MAKIVTYRGSVDLTKLKHETIIRNGKKCIVIPVEENPAIFFKVKEDNTKVINLDVEVRPTPNNQYGNSHYIRLSVGKESRQKYGISNDQLKEYTPIVGNLKEFTFDDNTAAGAPAAAAPAAAPEQFDGSW